MNPVLQSLGCLVVFLGLVFGLGLPLVVGLPGRAGEKIALAPGAALIVIYLAAFAIYGFNLPAWSFGLLPAAALAGLGWRFRAVAAVLRDSETRRLLRAYLVWTGWGLGFLALVRSYFGVGAGATGDWVEHFQRTCFFLGHWPLDYRFIWLYPLPARPPLANLATGAFLALTRENFACFQIFSTLESGLILLPGWLLCRRLGGARPAECLFLLLCMLNPLLLHNATYPWTKLITAYFVLAGLFLFLQGRTLKRAGCFAGALLFLSAGLLAHYSAGPYLLVLALIHLFSNRRRWFTRAFVTETGGAVLPSVLLLATWFGWSWTHYGPAATTLSSTAVRNTDVSSVRSFAAQKLGNVVSSLIPLPLREPAQVPPGLPGPAGATLDQDLYQFYQLSLPFAFGFAGAVFLVWRLGRKCVARAGTPPPADRRFWAVFLLGAVLVGTMVNGEYDRYGLANVCLQPLVILGLAFLAAELPDVRAGFRRVFWAGAALDFILGVVLHFHVEHMDLALWRTGASALPGALASARIIAPLWTNPALSNLLAKYYFGLTFLGDEGLSPWLLSAFLACLLLLVLHRLAGNGRTLPTDITGGPTSNHPPGLDRRMPS